ncbi:MAG TPA: diguanylate cyclase [Candidatus Acidoferrales bacterium]|jgi:diguanylate cyclase (GGDEF)-like protein|nr:diguanylate cyclase [Candidatus Acidoferrales bacterium]
MKVLIANDAPVSRHLLEVALKGEGYQIVVAEDGAETLRILEEDGYPRIVILDWMMPQADGVEICRSIRKRAREPYVYLILLTAKGEQTEIIEGLEAGADDYMIKPFDLRELKARVRSGRRIVELEEQLLSARELLRMQATHDSLTGLFNRAAILDMLQTELARAFRERRPLSIIATDLDRFKNVNDTYGHQAGDAVLVEITRRMQGSLRAYDAVGRCGGEEFLIVSPGCAEEDAVELAERLRQNVSIAPVQCARDVIPVTVSLGVATVAGDIVQADEFLRAADEALYKAKRTGRNRVVVGSQVLQ